jgi:hypothetical protein
MRTLPFLLLGLAFSLEAAPNPLARTEPLALRKAVPSQAPVARHALFELTLDLAASYDNPFNPEEVDVWAVFTSPQGGAVRVNGFLFQPFTRRLDQGTEKIEPAGEPVWKIRFTPDMEGMWRYRVWARDRQGRASLPEATCQVTASTNAGFIRRSQTNPRAFAFENGQPYFAVGENMCWGGKRGSFDYDDWVPALAQAGGNWIRIWMCSWNCALEWAAESRGEWRAGRYHGVGVYSLDNAWKLDTILDLAERHGLAVMLCLGTYGEFNDGGFFGEGQWKANPYNRTNGGPCLKPADFWTDAQARSLYRQRLRYLAARYGWRTGLQSWEFWNEAKAPAPWVAEMARCLKGTGEFAGAPADPFGHLVTTTYGEPAVWRIPEIDFSQSHHYGMGDVPDHAPVIHEDARAHAGYGKPHLMGEFGIDWRSPDNKYDPAGAGLNLHNGLWASALSGDAGGAMIWWWDNYVHPRQLYSHFTPLRRFTDAVPWNAGEWRRLEIVTPRQTVALQESEGVVMPATSGWGRSAAEFSITGDDGAGSATLPQFLFSPAKANEHTRPVFRFTFDRPGRFACKINTVSDQVKLRFTLDGTVARELTLSAVPPTNGSRAEYESTELNKQWNLHQARFNKEYGIEVPAGAHRLQVEVRAGDWASVDTYTLTGFSRISRRLPLNLYGLACGSQALLWAQNSGHNWKSVQEKKPIAAAPAAEILLPGLPAGAYLVTWWDTWGSGPLREERATAGPSGLALQLPSLEKDVAARITPAKKE